MNLAFYIKLSKYSLPYVATNKVHAGILCNTRWPVGWGNKFSFKKLLRKIIMHSLGSLVIFKVLLPFYPNCIGSK